MVKVNYYLQSKLGCHSDDFVVLKSEYTLSDFYKNFVQDK